MSELRLTFVKPEQRWVFKWDADSVAHIISHVANLARDKDSGFDWFDAATVCKHVSGVTPKVPA